MLGYCSPRTLWGFPLPLEYRTIRYIMAYHAPRRSPRLLAIRLVDASPCYSRIVYACTSVESTNQYVSVRYPPMNRGLNANGRSAHDPAACGL